MKRNMKQWLADYISAPVKKAMPVLSFPGVQIIGHTVDELVKSGELQAPVSYTHLSADGFHTLSGRAGSEHHKLAGRRCV